jgi:hypothetical protein
MQGLVTSSEQFGSLKIDSTVAIIAVVIPEF